MLRQLLVCLEPSPGNHECQEAAVDMGVHAGVALTGVFVRRPPPLTPVPPLPTPVFAGGYAIPDGPLDERVIAHQAVQDRMEREAFDAFVRRARGSGLRVDTVARTGALRSELVAAARATDLVLIGRGHAADESLLTGVTGALVRAAGRPVLIVGRWREPLSTIAVAYDGSAGADRALAVAAELVTRWSGPKPGIVLLGVTADAADEPAFLEPARHYLHACDLSPRTVLATGDPAAGIASLARTVDADLLCMGAYGHSLIREALLGSTTQQVLASWPRALLLAHE